MGFGAVLSILGGVLIFVVAPCAFPASILLILGIGTGAVQGRYQKTRLGADLSIGNWVPFIDFGRNEKLRSLQKLVIFRLFV